MLIIYPENQFRTTTVREEDNSYHLLADGNYYLNKNEAKAFLGIPDKEFLYLLAHDMIKSVEQEVYRRSDLISFKNQNVYNYEEE